MKIPIKHVVRELALFWLQVPFVQMKKTIGWLECGGLFWFSYSGTCWSARLSLTIRVKYLCILSLIKSILNIFYIFHKQCFCFSRNDRDKCLSMSLEDFYALNAFSLYILTLCKTIFYSLIVAATIWWVFYIHSIQHSPFFQDIHL